MRLWVGSSGYSYDFWEGAFYPEGLPSDERLAFYAERFSTVEINNTFYRMPKREVVERWAAAVPEGFRFVIKASRRITHQKRLDDVDDPVGFLLQQLQALGDKRGPILFQTPPFLPKRLDRLQALIALLPEGTQAAFELRHASWSDPEVEALVAETGHALCVAEHETGAPERPLPRTRWGYLRLRAPDYDDAQLRRWVERLREAWEQAWVFFKHEETAPALVRRMNAIATQMGIEV